MTGSTTSSSALRHDVLATPIGDLIVIGDGTAIVEIRFAAPGEPEPTDAGPREPEAVADAVAQLRAYVAGELTDFDLPLAPQGTEFQQRVWQALRTIPYGSTVTYGELARELGDPNASRAVGLANGRNPIPVVVPCHRVIGADGTLTGYAGGVDRKRWLLDLEAGRTALAVTTA